MNMSQATQAMLERGIHVFNADLLAKTEAEHVTILLDLMQPPQGAIVLDAGCGVGGVAALMQAARPDLSFRLLNNDAEQLELCPPEMHRILADFDRMPMEDESVDVVMFNFALCHSPNWYATLAEARRVLREGGVLFIYDMARIAGDNAMMAKELKASAWPLDAIKDCVQIAGFDGWLRQHTPVVRRLRDVSGSAAIEAIADEVAPMSYRGRKVTVEDEIESAFARHTRIAFQFSGGRDSTTALNLLRPWWNRMKVYHLDTGDQFPEARAVVDAFNELVPITRITSDVHAVRAQFGMPSDIVPVDNTDIGQLVSGAGQKIQSRYECCARALMNPMHERMRQDGVTLIIRGQRADEYASSPASSGDKADGFEVLFPIQSWTAAQVDAYIAEHELPVAPFYAQGMKRAPECMGCTAWWDEGRAEYLERNHPAKFQVYEQRITIIRRAIGRQLSTLLEKKS